MISQFVGNFVELFQNKVHILLGESVWKTRRKRWKEGHTNKLRVILYMSERYIEKKVKRERVCMRNRGKERDRKRQIK
jgi:hypothetical protein